MLLVKHSWENLAGCANLPTGSDPAGSLCLMFIVTVYIWAWLACFLCFFLPFILFFPNTIAGFAKVFGVRGFIPTCYMVKDDALSLSVISLVCLEVKLSEYTRAQRKPGNLFILPAHHTSFMIFRK